MMSIIDATLLPSLVSPLFLAMGLMVKTYDFGKEILTMHPYAYRLRSLKVRVIDYSGSKFSMIISCGMPSKTGTPNGTLQSISFDSYMILFNSTILFL